MPGAHSVAAAPAAPHVTTHSELSVQVTLQSTSHLTVQLDEPEHAAELSSPSSSLQLALDAHVTVALASSLKSQLELSAQVIALLGPPAPLHCEESLQVTVN